MENGNWLYFSTQNFQLKKINPRENFNWMENDLRLNSYPHTLHDLELMLSGRTTKTCWLLPISLLWGKFHFSEGKKWHQFKWVNITIAILFTFMKYIFCRILEDLEINGGVGTKYVVQYINLLRQKEFWISS